tara:strand:+ start:5014 stop:5619 length:606 start_codon:yes stop_codon:yes gene_type:complete
MQAHATTDNAVHTIVALLTDRTRSVMQLCDLTGLDLPTLARLIESEPVQSALAAVRRITAVRLEFIAAESDFIATAVLQDIAKTTPDAPRAAEIARKAANAIRTKKSQPRQPNEPRASARAVAQEPTHPNPIPEHPSPNPGHAQRSADRDQLSETSPNHPANPMNTRPTNAPGRTVQQHIEATPEPSPPRPAATPAPSAVR